MHKMFAPLALATLGACHHPEAAFGRKLIECVDLAQTRAEADACRAKVELEYADASGYVADAGAEGGAK